jgi:glycosyltransferase involved in cell wall biosynthesis
LSISCVMPAYNEARNLPQLVPAVLQALMALAPQVELILVNDGSRDGTVHIVRDLCAQWPPLVLLDLSRNFGKEAALTAGLEAAKGQVVVVMDGDGQHPTDLLAVMVEQWRQGMDVVYAVRSTRDDQSALHGWLTAWFYRLINWGGRVEIPAHAGDFRLMDRRVVDALNALPERNRFMKGLYAWVGFPSVAVGYEPLPRQDGQSRFGLRGAFALALTGMLAFSTVPLRLMAFVGLLLAVSALGYGLWVVTDYLLWGIDVPGYATIVVSLMFFSGLQLLSLGVMAEYVGRIYDEVKRRPVYILKQRWGAGLTGPSPTHRPDKQA